MASTIAAITTGTGGVVTTADSSGDLSLLSGTTTVVAVTSAGVAVTGTLAATGAVTLTGSLNTPNTFGFKNRIINGGMVIDQRNAGAAVTVDNTYSVDRFLFRETTDGTASIQQSSTAPTGFVNSILFTVTSTDSSLSTNQYASIQQKIEGFNIADLGWGTANAQTVTLSFWVRSSVIGAFGASFTNSAGDRSYPFNYTINAANTFEQKTITVAGDTSGTWLTTTGIGIQLNLAVAAASNLLGTANTWASAAYFGATGATNLMATNGATFYITGVQLEKGATATSFDFRDYGREFALCQRYFTKFTGNDASGGYAGYGAGYTGSSSRAVIFLNLPVAMRSAPTLATSGTNRIIYSAGGGITTTTSGSFGNVQMSSQNGYFTIDVASGTPLTAGTVAALSADTDLTASLSFTAEL